MHRLLTAIILLFVAAVTLMYSVASFAATPSELASVHAFAKTLSPPSTDYSVAYLSQIFGTVGNVLQGSSGQILGIMFGLFNKGLLVIAALWLGYSTATMVLHGANDGSFGGKNANVPIIFLRIALGFAALIPSTTTGYSILQDLFMKIVIQGVGLADQVWDAALNYLQYGGSLYIPPSTLANDVGVVTGALGQTQPLQYSQSPLAPVVQIFQDEVCMVKSTDWSTGSTDATWTPVFVPPVVNPATQTAAANITWGMVYFPGRGDHHSAAEVIKQGSTACGQAVAVKAKQNLPASSNASSSGVSSGIALTFTQKQYMATYSYTALKALVENLLPAASLYVKLEKEENTLDTTEVASMTKNIVKTIFSSLVDYTNLITPFQQTISDAILGGGGTSDHAFMDNARAEGWITAGGFYWSVEQANTNAEGISLNHLFPNATAGAPFGSEKETYLFNAATFIFNTAQNTTPSVRSLWDVYIHVQESNYNAPNSDDSNNAMATGAAGMLGTDVANAFNVSSDYNPISSVMDLGEKLLDACVAMWIIAIAISVGLAFPAGICDSTSPGLAILDASLMWFKSIMMLLTSILMAPGAILAYYVPLYPFAVFTFAAVGWLLTVVEGMAAAPLICLGVTHPEGHDFLGKGEQALMLFLSIFLRPTLMVIGLISAMVVSFVAFQLLISGFGNVLSSLVNTSHSALGNGFLILISLIMVLTIFGMMTMELIEQCYKLIFQLPNYILKWIGGPQTGEDYGQMGAQVRGAVSGAGSSAGSTMSKSAKSAGESAQFGVKTNAKLQEAKTGGDTIGAANKDDPASQI